MIDKDLSYYEEQRALGRSLVKRMTLPILLSPILYLPIFYLLQIVLKTEFEARYWLIWAFTPPTCGLFMIYGIYVSVRFRGRWTLNARGIKRRTNPGTIPWSRIKHWKIAEASAPPHRKILIIYLRWVRDPVRLVLSSEPSEQEIVDFIARYDQRSTRDMTPANRPG